MPDTLRGNRTDGTGPSQSIGVGIWNYGNRELGSGGSGIARDPQAQLASPVRVSGSRRTVTVRTHRSHSSRQCVLAYSLCLYVIVTRIGKTTSKVRAPDSPA